MLRRQSVPQTMLRGESLGAGVAFRINDHASLPVEGCFPDDRKSIRSWFIADHRMNVSLRLSF